MDHENMHKSRTKVDWGRFSRISSLDSNWCVMMWKMTKKSEKSHLRFLWPGNLVDFRFFDSLNLQSDWSVHLYGLFSPINDANLVFSNFLKISTSSFGWDVLAAKNDHSSLIHVQETISD